MQYLFIEKLKSYIAVNNPDLLIRLEDTAALRQYLEDKVATVMPYAAALIIEQKPQYAIEELCMGRLTADLRPSKFNYLQSILAEEFPERYARFTHTGIATYELLNMLEVCQPVFDKHSFNEATEDSRMLRYEITGTVLDYLSGN